MTIMVLGAGGNAAWNYIKSLRLDNISEPILGLDTNSYHLMASNTDIPYALNNDENKITTIKELIDHHNVSFIHAQPDTEVKFLLSHQDELGQYITKGSLDEWNMFNDKLYCQEKWIKELDLQFSVYAYPFIENNPILLETIIEKTGRAWIRAITGAGSIASLPISNTLQAKGWVNYWHSKANMRRGQFMVSDFLPGKEYAVQTFWIDGELIHSQARERVEYVFGNQMPSGQSSSPSVAKIANDSDIYNTAYKAIKSLVDKPHGIYCIDMKKSRYDQLIPTEVNYGRYFTTSNFFAALGVNTPAMEYHYHISGIIDFKIETIQEEFFWIRGMDREPFLCLLQ